MDGNGFGFRDVYGRPLTGTRQTEYRPCSNLNQKATALSAMVRGLGKLAKMRLYPGEVCKGHLMGSRRFKIKAGINREPCFRKGIVISNLLGNAALAGLGDRVKTQGTLSHRWT